MVQEWYHNMSCKAQGGEYVSGEGETRFERYGAINLSVEKSPQSSNTQHFKQGIFFSMPGQNGSFLSQTIENTSYQYRRKILF